MRGRQHVKSVNSFGKDGIAFMLYVNLENENMNKTALNDVHKKLGAKLVDFHGWELPIQYKSILKEHAAVRESTGIFDCSHMGQIFIKGKDAHRFTDFLITNKFQNKKDGEGVYSPLLYENGTFVDDLICYALHPDKVLLIVNASNVDKDFAWIQKHSQDFEVSLENASEEFSLLAIQGKTAAAVIETLFPDTYENMTSFSICEKEYEGQKCFIAKTGYTGETGVEVIIKNEGAPSLMEKAVEYGAIPCGLGARDSLRLEKGYSLYGNEIDDTTNALEAGLKWTVKFDKGNFIGKEALLKIQEEKPKRKIIGFKAKGRFIARQGDVVLDLNEKPIGIVTSGIFSPTLKEAVGLAYVDSNYSEATVLLKMNKKMGEADITKRMFV
jgi:aminomethyltransferase